MYDCMLDFSVCRVALIIHLPAELGSHFKLTGGWGKIEVNVWLL